MLHNWWRKLMNHRFGATSRGRRKTALQTLSRQLRLEILEDRLAPALHTWTGSTSAIWSVPGNWQGGAPVVGEPNITLTFPSLDAANFTNINDIPGLTVQSITFNGGASYVLGGQPITLTNSITASYPSSSLGSFRINFNITLGGTPVNVHIDLGQGGALAGALSGSGGLSKDGSGELALNNNTYSGGTTLNSGTLAVTNTNSLGTGTLTMNGGKLLVPPPGGALTIPNPFSVGGPATITCNRSANFTGQGTLASGGVLRVNGTTTSTFSGPLSGPGTLIADGSVTLSAANTYTGATIVGDINSGNLQQGVVNAIPATSAVTIANGSTVNLNGFNAAIGSLKGAGSVTFGTGATLTTGGDHTSTTFSGVIGANGSLTKVGMGTLTLTGANTYGGPTTLMAGVLEVGNSAALGTGPLILSGGTLQALASITLANPSFTVSGPATLGGSSNITLALPGTLTGGNLLTVNNTSGTVTLSGAIGGTGGLTKLGTGTLILTSTNTYSGTTTLTDGIIEAGSNAALGAGPLALNGGTLRASASIALTNPSFTVGGPATLGGSNNLTLTGAGTLNGSNTLTVNNTSGTVSLSGAIGGTGGITKMGAGQLVLSGTNTYAGATNISSGTLVAGGDNALPSNASVSVGNVGTLVFDSGTLTFQLAASLSGAGSVVFSGGTVTVHGSYSVSGSTTVTGGSVTLDGANPTLGSLTISGNGTFTANSSLNTDSLTLLSGLLSGTGNVTAAIISWTGGA
jgi:autotransporter-associated beta strand protein